MAIADRHETEMDIGSPENPIGILPNGINQTLNVLYSNEFSRLFPPAIHPVLGSDEQIAVPIYERTSNPLSRAGRPEQRFHPPISLKNKKAFLGTGPPRAGGVLDQGADRPSRQAFFFSKQANCPSLNACDAANFGKADPETAILGGSND
jgi:hypothetical protein